MPQTISPATWLAIEKAVVAGMGYSEASRAFKVSVHAIMMKSRRNRWPVPSRIQERAALQSRYRANDVATETLTQSWAGKGEQHRALAFDLAHNSLKAAAKRGLPAECWKDLDLADRMARRSAQLDDETHSVNLSMQLVNWRPEHINLPKDGLCEPGDAPRIKAGPGW